MFKKLVFLTYLVGLVLLVLNYQDVADWWSLRSYSPSSEIAALAASTTMTDDARKTFYVTDPAISDKTAFNQHCPIAEETLVLGCYAQGRIYILQVDKNQLRDVMDVTAAHEMLHAAYDRLSKREREEIDQQVSAAFAKQKDPELIRLINNYPEEVRLNELHSILGTQVTELPSDLEAYYSRYFKDRQKVVRLYLNYEKVFTNIKNRVDALQTEVENIRAGLSLLEVQINQKKAEVESLNARMKRLRAQGDTEGYNALVPKQNQAVKEYNALVEEYRNMVNQHNQKVALLNRLVLQQNDLVDSLDSKKFDEI